MFNQKFYKLSKYALRLKTPSINNNLKYHIRYTNTTTYYNDHLEYILETIIDQKDKQIADLSTKLTTANKKITELTYIIDKCKTIITITTYTSITFIAYFITHF